METIIFHTQAFIIALALGYALALSLKIKKHIMIALVIVGLYIILVLLFIKLSGSGSGSGSDGNSLLKPLSVSSLNDPSPTPTINSISSSNIIALQNVNSVSNFTSTSTMPLGNISNEPVDDDLPLDNLSSTELMKRLNYIYAQTASPVKIPVHSAEGTPYDATLTDITNGKNATVPVKQPLSGFTEWLYPQLNNSQVNTRDCTNFSPPDKRSCIQRPDWNNNFPLKNCPTTTRPPSNYKEAMKQSLLLAGINNGVESTEMNNNLLEKFSSSMNMNNFGWNETPDNKPSALSINEAINSNSSSNILYKNAPKNSFNNYNISKNLCRTCKTGVCKNDICI
jgi:hypothetical protein